MLLERLGVLTDEVSPNLAEALDWAASQGLRHVEIRTVEGRNAAKMNDDELAVIRAEVERRGLFISALASPLFKCALDPLRAVASGDTFGQKEESVESHFAMLQRCLEIARLLGTNKIRVFSFWRELNPEGHVEEIVRHLRRAAEAAERAGVLLLLENEPSCNGGYADEVGRIVRLVGSAHLKALWDPGNEEYGGRPAFPEGYELVRDVLAHIHLKDAIVDETGKSQCVPIGSGRVRFLEQFAALVRGGYDGLFTIETHYIPQGGTAKDGTQQSLDGLRRLLAEGGQA